MKIYKGIPKKLNIISEKIVNENTYVIVNGYKDINKVVGYSNEVKHRNGFISFLSTQFKNIETANNWLNSK